MCTHNDLLIRKLVAAAYVVTLEPDLLQHLLFQFAKRFEFAILALAWNLKVLRKHRRLPLSKAGTANI